MKLLIVATHILTGVIVLNHVESGNYNRVYYWRTYNWTIPEDAVPAGKDSSGQETYIGQVYMNGDGLIVAQIFPGAKEVFAYSYDYKKATADIKILCCKDKNKLYWVRGNSKYLHVNMTQDHPVIGGFNHREPTQPVLYVGRVFHHVVTRIGSVGGYLETARMTYAHDNSYQVAEDYDVLVQSVDGPESCVEYNYNQ